MSSWKSRQAARHVDVFVVIRIVFNLRRFGFDWRFGTVCYSSRRKHGSLAPGSTCVNWNVAYYSRNIASYSICLDVKCSNSSNHRRLVSVPVPRIRDVSLLCYRFQSERITETAKRSNVVITWIAFCPTRDFWSQTGTFWRPEDRVRDSGTEYPKPGLSRKNRDGWSACACTIFCPAFNVSGLRWCALLM